MDLNSLPIPILITLLAGKVLKSHPKIQNDLIPWLLMGGATLTEMAKQFSGTTASIDPAAAVAAAVPIVAGAVLTHKSGTGLMTALKWVARVVQTIATAPVAPARALNIGDGKGNTVEP